MRSHFTVFPIWKLSDDVAIIVMCPHIKSFIKINLHSCQIGREVRLHVLVACKITEDHKQYIHLSLWILSFELQRCTTQPACKIKVHLMSLNYIYRNISFVLLSVFISPLYFLSLFDLWFLIIVIAVIVW